jgi:hypothetical protein
MSDRLAPCISHPGFVINRGVQQNHAPGNTPLVSAVSGGFKTPQIRQYQRLLRGEGSSNPRRFDDIPDDLRI